MERIEKAYSFIATSGVDVKLSVKILKVFYLSRQSEPFFLLNNESNLSSYSLEKAIRGQLTPEEVRDNFGALATMIADAAAESQEVSEEYSLGKLFQIAFSGDVPDDAQLHANPEVIQQAARVAMRDLESAAPEHSLGRLTFGGSLRKVKTEELTKCLEVYHSFLKRTGNAWEGMGSQVIGVRNHLGVKGLV